MLPGYYNGQGTKMFMRGEEWKITGERKVFFSGRKEMQFVFLNIGKGNIIFSRSRGFEINTKSLCMKILHPRVRPYHQSINQINLCPSAKYIRNVQQRSSSILLLIHIFEKVTLQEFLELFESTIFDVTKQSVPQSRCIGRKGTVRVTHRVLGSTRVVPSEQDDLSCLRVVIWSISVTSDGACPWRALYTRASIL